jgi:hypothetical protein
MKNRMSISGHNGSPTLCLTRKILKPTFIAKGMKGGTGGNLLPQQTVCAYVF